jgi:transcriptional regulator with XRE-family HTH domain
MAEQLMTKEQVRQALDELGMSQRELARFLRVNDRTVRAWVSPIDTAEPYNPACMILLYLLGTKSTPSDFADGVYRGLARLERRGRPGPA